MTKLIPFLLLAVNLSPLFAFLSEKGSTTFTSVKIPLSAKSQALGGAGVAISGDGAYATLNPALIRTLEGDNIYLEHINLYQDMRIEFLNATLSYKLFPLGVSLQYLDLGNGPIVNDNGSDYTQDNSFHAYEAMAAFSSGAIFKTFTLGLTVKALRQAIWDYSANGAALDVGLLFPTPMKNLTAGLSLQNLGFTDAPTDDQFPLTSMLRMGVFYHKPLNDDISLGAALDLNSANDKTITLPAGLELTYKSLSLRTGYHFFHDTRTFSAGFGFTFGNLTLDYCYIHHTDDFNSNGRPHFFALSLLI